VVMFEDANLWNQRGDVPDEEYLIPFGIARIARQGTDLTIAAVAGGNLAACESADRLATEGISAEVIDVRSLAPLDTTTICESVVRTGRLLIVDPAHRTCSAASEIAAVVQEEAWSDLLGPVVRLTTPDLQVPFSPSLEDGLYPTTEAVMAAARAMVGVSVPGGAG
jgi:acetoin:2,6-dichlorophenolindophenol oxidoreductase subunit beta